MNEPPLFEVVDCETARARTGLRLVVLGAGPSPWSEAAKAIFRVKRLPATWVRFTPRDEAVLAWTGSHNAPVAIYEDEPPRTHWSDIVMLGERLGGARALVPTDDDERARMFGLIHEIAGEDGLNWSARAMALAESLASAGARSFPERLGKFLHRKYGGRELDASRSRARVLGILDRLASLLRERHPSGEGTFLDHGLSALDLHAAAATWMLAPLSDELSPMAAPMRAAATYLADALGTDMPRILLAHRDFIYREHLGLPLAL